MITAGQLYHTARCCNLIVYSDKLAHVQVVINCQYSIAQMCTWEDTHARLFSCAILDDVMSHSEFTTSIAPSRVLLGGFRSLLTPALKTLLKPSVTFRDKRSNGGQKRRVLEACSWSKLPVIQWAAKSCNSFEYMTPIVPGIQMKTVFGCLVSESYCTGLQNKTLTPSL